MPITGVEYQGKQTEYQYFPEDYFSGSDVTVYFDDVFMEDLQGLEFGMQEKVQPVYGYNSFTYDAVARGQRVVQGTFTIAFKEAGYMRRIMSHIAGLKVAAKPFLAYYLGGQASKKPEWAGNVDETIEDILNRKAGMSTDSSVVEQAPSWANIALGSSGDSVEYFTRWILAQDKMNRYKGIYVLPAMASVKKSYKVGVPDNSLKIYKQRLNTYLVDSGAKLMLHKLNVTSPNYDTAFVTALKIFQKNFSKSLAVDGVLGAKTLEALHKGLSVSRICQAPEKLAIMMFQKANGLKVDGILGPSTRSKIKITVSVSKDTLNMGAEGEFAAYEASIWSEQSTYEASYNSNPHFYSAGQDVLRTTGFDIYINYGPLVEDLRTDNKTGDLVSYNNTVKAIRGVQLTGMQQMLSPTGDVIAERYSFIAKDLD